MNQHATIDEPPAARLQLGRFDLDLPAGELRGPDGRIAPLRRQALEVLLVLARRAGHVVSKDELMAAVWPGVVVGEGSIAQAVADIRRLLGEAGHHHVRNVARRGYMLVTEPPNLPDAPDAPASTATPHPPGMAAPVTVPRRPWPGVAGAAALLLLFGVAGWLAFAVPTAAWRAPGTPPPLPADAPVLSILVLPFATDGGAASSDAWLAEALHGDVVGALARLPGSHVISRDTAASYRGRGVDARRAAREMGVRHVIDGRLRQQGTQLGLEFALIDGETGVQRWSGSFDSDRATLAGAVGDFAVAIERTLASEMYRFSAARAATLSPAQVGADDLAMQGFAWWYRGVTRENVTAARDLFERALELNPDSWRAWAGVQFTTANQLMNGWAEDRAAVLRRHNEAVSNLERVDRDGSQTYSGKTFMLFAKRDFAAMLRNTTEWTERHRLPLAYGAHGAALLLNARFDEAVPAIERALRMGPRDPFRAEWQYRLALAHWGAGRYELARDWSQTAANTTPSLVWPPIHAAAMLRLGQATAARQAFAEFAERHPGFTAAQIVHRMPGTHPAYVEMRERLQSSLGELGLR